MTSEISACEVQAKSAILQILSELKISRIIYVDDRCSINELKESFLGKVNSLYEIKPSELTFIDWDTPRPVFEKEVNNLWDEKNEDERNRLFVQVLTFENNKGELDSSIAPMKIKEVLGDKIIVISPTDWLSQKDNIISSLSSENRILFLFDIKYEYAPLPDGRDGLDLAVELMRNSSKEYIYCALFSHLFSIYEEYEKRDQYCKEYTIEKNNFYTISKKRFSGDTYLSSLTEGIKNTLLINEVDNLKDESSKILRKSFDDSMAEIGLLSPEAFNHIIQKSSKEEGVWEFTSLFRLSNIITYHNALDCIKPPEKRKIINECLDKIRKFERINTGRNTPFDIEEIIRLRNKELYIEGDKLNELYTPLSNGDMFNINKKEYILLAQPCNIMVRNNGERNRNYNIGFLLEIQTINKDVVKKYDKGQLETIYIIDDPSISSECKRVVRFSTNKSIHLSPLDLTVFNSDGVSRISLNESENSKQEITDSWKKRYKNLYKEFLAYSESVKVFADLVEARKEVFKNSIFYGSLFFGYNLNNENSFKEELNILEYDIQRTKHYRSPYSDTLLHRFMLYLSRTAFEKDFTANL